MLQVQVEPELPASVRAPDKHVVYNVTEDVRRDEAFAQTASTQTTSRWVPDEDTPRSNYTGYVLQLGL